MVRFGTVLFWVRVLEMEGVRIGVWIRAGSGLVGTGSGDNGQRTDGGEVNMSRERHGEGKLTQTDFNDGWTGRGTRVHTHTHARTIVYVCVCLCVSVCVLISLE